MKITAHAQERAYERTEIKNREDLCAYVDGAVNEGIDALADPTLRPLCYNYAVRKNSSGMYAFRGIVFIFIDASLVTILPIAWLADYDRRGYHGG
jgi:hypothetical protein